MSAWVHAICGACWIKREGERPPARMRHPRAETCCGCGEPTTSGIYQHNDPDEFGFCNHKDS